METVEMTREELDEAIALLREPKPAGRPLNDEFADDSPEYVWWWWVDGEEWMHANYSTDISSAKRLTDALVEEGWGLMIMWNAFPKFNMYEVSLYAPKNANAVHVKSTTEELARCMAYYEAKTGKRVVVKDE